MIRAAGALATFRVCHGAAIYMSPSTQESAGDFFFLLLVLLPTILTVAIVALAVRLIRHHQCKSEEEASREEDNQAYLELNLEEQELFFQSKEFLASNPYVRQELTLSQNLSIQEKGIQAWEFTKDPMLTNNDVVIINRYEITFFKKFECSVQSNLPVPSTNDVYYFESKIFSLPNPQETKLSIGLGTKPYPWFRLPGRHPHTISYDSDGYRRHNQPFKFEKDPPFPPIIEGDVIGVGYRVRSGTVFFTRNGKKLNELKIGGHIKNFRGLHGGQIYPIIGANNLCSIHVNVGQMGYVLIEGNVKKWGFAPLEGSGPAPPAYKKFNGDVLLARSEIDEENDLADRANDFPPDFWKIHGNDSLIDLNDKFSYSLASDASADERISLHSLIPNFPPTYDNASDYGEHSDLSGILQNHVVEGSYNEEDREHGNGELNQLNELNEMNESELNETELNETELNESELNEAELNENELNETDQNVEHEIQILEGTEGAENENSVEETQEVQESEEAEETEETGENAVPKVDAEISGENENEVATSASVNDS